MIGINNLIDTYLQHQLLNMDPITSDEDIELVARMTAVSLQNHLPEYTTPILVHEMHYQVARGKWQDARGLLWSTYFTMDLTVPIQVVGVCRNEDCFAKFVSYLNNLVQH